MITVEQFYERCGCRSVGECDHNLFVESEASIGNIFAMATPDGMTARITRSFPKSFASTSTKGDMVDVANLAMMLWNFNQPATQTAKLQEGGK